MVGSGVDVGTNVDTGFGVTVDSELPGCTVGVILFFLVTFTLHFNVTFFLFFFNIQVTLVFPALTPFIINAVLPFFDTEAILLFLDLTVILNPFAFFTVIFFFALTSTLAVFVESFGLDTFAYTPVPGKIICSISAAATISPIYLLVCLMLKYPLLLYKVIVILYLLCKLDYAKIL